MRLAGVDGDVGQAWLDAGALSPEYDGIRCAIEIGAEGGLLCTAVDAPQRTGEGLLRQVATDAVVALEESTMGSVPAPAMCDASGRPVELDVGEDDTPPIDYEVVVSTEEDLRGASRRVGAPVAPLASAMAMVAVATACIALGAGGTDATAVFVFVVLVGLVSAGFALDAWRHKIMLDRGADQLEGTAAREIERRRALDALVRATVGR
jgi:hypothetical protein